MFLLLWKRLKVRLAQNGWGQVEHSPSCSHIPSYMLMSPIFSKAFERKEAPSNKSKQVPEKNDNNNNNNEPTTTNQQQRTNKPTDQPNKQPANKQPTNQANTDFAVSYSTFHIHETTPLPKKKQKKRQNTAAQLFPLFFFAHPRRPLGLGIFLGFGFRQGGACSALTAIRSASKRQRSFEAASWVRFFCWGVVCSCVFFWGWEKGMKWFFVSMVFFGVLFLDCWGGVVAPDFLVDLFLKRTCSKTMKGNYLVFYAFL